MNFTSVLLSQWQQNVTRRYRWYFSAKESGQCHFRFKNSTFQFLTKKKKRKKKTRKGRPNVKSFVSRVISRTVLKTIDFALGCSQRC